MVRRLKATVPLLVPSRDDLLAWVQSEFPQEYATANAYLQSLADVPCTRIAGYEKFAVGWLLVDHPRPPPLGFPWIGPAQDPRWRAL